MSTTPSLSGALSSLQTSTALLSSTISFLDASTADLPRLSRVLAQRRHFELLPSSTLAAAQDAVVSELAPELDALLARAEAHVERLERREQGLRARWELQEGRLGRESSSAVSRYSGVAGGKVGRGDESGVVGGRALGPREEMKAKQLRQKKERLSYAVDRLQLQASQAERKLRMSMAAQEQQQQKQDRGRAGGDGHRGGRDDEEEDADELA